MIFPRAFKSPFFLEKSRDFSSILDTSYIYSECQNIKKRLKNEGADQLLTNCKQLKLQSPKDGKRYKTDVANIEQLFRIIQSIPSPKAEPLKMWLAEVGRERVEETLDP